MGSHQQMQPNSMDHHAKQSNNIGSHQKKLPTLQGRDSYERMNFLVQGAMTALAKTPHNIELVRHYMKSVRGIKSKKVLRWSREMKHSYCSGCHMLLVAGITTQVRVKVLLPRTQCSIFLLNYTKLIKSFHLQTLGRCAQKSAQFKPLAVVADTFQKKDDKEKKLTKVDDWTEVKAYSLKEKLGIYAKLSKARLTGLVVLTAAAGYAIAPAPMVPIALLCTVIGTTLCSASANSLNQFLEVPYDCQMMRTRDRVLVRGLLRPLDAVLFGIGTGTIGIIALSFVNPITAILGALNIFLYAGIYTPSKRYHIANTWIGSLVGGIPPLMGWAACTGSLDMGALALAAVLYSWQFPHFNSLSWSYRPDYSRAGYKMMSVTDPALCRRVTLRHAALQIPIAAVVPLLGICHWWFFFLSLPFNAYLTLLSWRFYKSSNNNTARSLFRFTLLHLPAIMLLLLISKKRNQKNSLLVEPSSTGNE